MPDLDLLAPNYRRAQLRWPDAPTLARGYAALEACFNGSGYGLVEHIKSFVESVCITIMGEYRAPMPASQPTMTELLVAALAPIGLANTKGATKLDKVLSGFNRLSDALTEMRNETGTVAHGKDGFLEAITTDHARAFLHTGDAILAVLLNALEGKQPDLIVTREPYERFSHLNARIDRSVVVAAWIDDDGDRPIVVLSLASGLGGESFELRAEPSRLLFGIDREAYVEVLETTERAMTEEDEPPETAEVITETVDTAVPPSSATEGPVTEVAVAYAGRLDPIRAGAEAFLEAEGLDPTLVGLGGGRLIDSLLATTEQNLALDWRQREAVQARIKVASKRTLVRFGCEMPKADAVSERFVSWLRVQGPADEPPESVPPGFAGPVPS